MVEMFHIQNVQPIAIRLMPFFVTFVAERVHHRDGVTHVGSLDQDFFLAGIWVEGLSFFDSDSA